MNLIILGSGGCTTIPRPGCTCPICEEAREEGPPYSRGGPSLFVEDINALFDTPEDVSQQLNRENITTINHIFYTHWHPDHTLGMRVIEQINMFFLEKFVARKQPERKIMVYALPPVMEDLKAIKCKSGSYLDYYERNGLISPTLLKETPVIINDVEIAPILVGTSENISTIFLLSHKGKKVCYAPCDTKPFPLADSLKNLDLLIIGGILPGEKLKDGYVIPQDNELRREVYTMDELMEIIDTLHVSRTVAVHIEEEWGKSLDDYEAIEARYCEHNIQFAFDGMRITV